MRSITRGAVWAAAGAAIGVLSFAGLFSRDSRLHLEFDRDQAGFSTGFHPVERSGDVTFAWTSATAVMRLADLDRRAAWQCAIRVRSGRGADLTSPRVVFSVDGVAQGAHPAPAEFEDLPLTLPIRADRQGLTLAIDTVPTFVPGPDDPRELGVQVDRISCAPAVSGSLGVPRRAAAAAAAAGAIMGVVAWALGLGFFGAGALAVLLVAAAVPMAAGLAPYGDYPRLALLLAAWIAAVALLSARLVEWRMGRPLSTAAAAAIAMSAGLSWLKLLALLHPSKLVIDAVFHAHRLQWVLDGRFFFTQPMPDGVSFPYAIGLYVVSAPWALVSSDFVALLRIVVVATEAVAMLLLYPAVLRAWGDRSAAVLAVLFGHLVPLPFVVMGNANLTFAFGQAVALGTLALAVALPMSLGVGKPGVLLAAIGLLAFLSHVATFPFLLAALLALALVGRFLGGAAERAPARAIAAAAMAAAVLAVVTYYGHFGEVYQSLDRVLGRATSVAGLAAPVAGEAAGERSAGPVAGLGPGAGDRGPEPVSRVARVGTAGALAARDLGWPLLGLGLLGAWRLWRARAVDRLTLLAVALAVTYAVFAASSLLAPIQPGFVRYADEFLSRLHYAVAPAAVVLAARGLAFAWTSGAAFRVAGTLVLLGATYEAAGRWLDWIR